MLLFVLFYAQTWEFSLWLNNLQTDITLYFLEIFLDPNQLKGIAISINPEYKIIITKACNGMIPILFLFASILAYPSKLFPKVVWMVMGYIIFVFVNVLRILVVVYITKNGAGHQDFYWAHDLIGNTILMFTGLILFVLFIKKSSNH